MLKSFVYYDISFSKLYDYMSYLIAHFILLHLCVIFYYVSSI